MKLTDNKEMTKRALSKYAKRVEAFSLVEIFTTKDSFCDVMQFCNREQDSTSSEEQII
jgi:hypothetical protein